MIFPFLDANEEILDIDNLPIYREIAWDFGLNVPIIEENEFKIVEGIEAVKVWVYKAIKTARFEHEIYSWDYGCEMRDLTGYGFSKELIVSEVKRYVEEALMINEYIKEVNAVALGLNDDKLQVEVSINTYYGDTTITV